MSVAFTSHARRTGNWTASFIYIAAADIKVIDSIIHLFIFGRRTRLHENHPQPLKLADYAVAAGRMAINRTEMNRIQCGTVIVSALGFSGNFFIYLSTSNFHVYYLIVFGRTMYGPLISHRWTLRS